MFNTTTLSCAFLHLRLHDSLRCHQPSNLHQASHGIPTNTGHVHDGFTTRNFRSVGQLLTFLGVIATGSEHRNKVKELFELATYFKPTKMRFDFTRKVLNVKERVTHDTANFLLQQSVLHSGS